jgi:hypothetical protein
MHLRTLFLASALALAAPLGGFAADEAEKPEKVAVADLPAAVKDTFAKEAAGGEIFTIKKLGGDKPRYQIHYRLEGKEHQMTIAEDGQRTQHKKAD